MVRIYRIYYWLPTILWMAFIFGFSAQPSLHASSVSWQDFLIKKSAHVTEYFILGLFLNFSLKNSTKLSLRQRLLLLIIIGLVYAVSDEFHQTFIAGREGRIRDVLIDSLGVFGSAKFLDSFSQHLQ
jgi:VanZ family protein